MSKAQETREKILQQAAELFNQQGYAGASLSDLMKATGLQKGGIYNHFASKEVLAIQAFDFAFQQVSRPILRSLKGNHTAPARLFAFLDVFRSFVNCPPVAGGCPLLNTAIESDDGNPVLRDRVRQAMDSWQSLIHQIVSKGIQRGEIQASVDADAVASVLIATLEGAIMLSKLYDDPVYMERAIAHLTNYIDQLQTS